MTEKEKKIVELLQAGKSYTDIQKLLEVSPSKISQVKKEYCTTETDDSDSMDATTFATGSSNDFDNSSSDNSINKGLSPKETLGFRNKEHPDNNMDFELKYADKIELEKMKLNLAQEVELKKLEIASAEQELRWRELSLKERSAEAYEKALKEQLNEKARAMEAQREKEENERAEKRANILLSRFRKHIDKLEDGEWSKADLYEYLDKTVELKEKIETFCDEFDIVTKGLRMLEILETIEEQFETDLDADEHDDDYVFDLRFEALYDVIEEAQDVDFETYE